VILGKFWSRFDLRQRRDRKFLGDDQGCLLSEQTVHTVSLFEKRQGFTTVTPACQDGQRWTDGRWPQEVLWNLRWRYLRKAGWLLHCLVHCMLMTRAHHSCVSPMIYTLKVVDYINRSTYLQSHLASKIQLYSYLSHRSARHSCLIRSPRIMYLLVYRHQYAYKYSYTPCLDQLVLWCRWFIHYSSTSLVTNSQFHYYF
jgi:hypothetical protein